MTDEQREKKNAANRRHYQKHRARLLEEKRAYYLSNREEIQEKHRDYHRAHRAEDCARNREWYESHRAEALVKARERHASNRLEDNEKDRRWHKRNLARDVERHQEWRAGNPEKVAFYSANRRALETMAMPLWVNHEDIAAFYAEASRLSLLTGIPHDVDHIWPLNGDGFVGLHVPWNLRVIPASENRSKKNRRPDTLTLQTQGG